METAVVAASSYAMARLIPAPGAAAAAAAIAVVVSTVKEEGLSLDSDQWADLYVEVAAAAATAAICMYIGGVVGTAIAGPVGTVVGVVVGAIVGYLIAGPLYNLYNTEMDSLKEFGRIYEDNLKEIFSSLDDAHRFD